MVIEVIKIKLKTMRLSIRKHNPSQIKREIDDLAQRLSDMDKNILKDVYAARASRKIGVITKQNKTEKKTYTGFQDLHLLLYNLARRRLVTAGDAGVARGVGGNLLLLVRAADAAGLVGDWLCGSGSRGFVGLLLLLGFGHADEPVEGEGTEDVEDAVSPEDTFLVSVICFRGYERRDKGTYQSCAMPGCSQKKWMRGRRWCPRWSRSHSCWWRWDRQDTHQTCPCSSACIAGMSGPIEAQT